MYGGKVMEYNVTENFVKSTFKAQRCELFGQLLKRYDVVNAKKDLTEDQKKDLLKTLWNELMHESFRDLETRFSCFSKGLKYFKVNLTRPESDFK